MLRFIVRRIALIVPTFIGVTLIAFALIHLIPGDPVENLSGERGMDPARRERLLHEFGLDRPLPVQYGEYIGNVVRGVPLKNRIRLAGDPPSPIDPPSGCRFRTRCAFAMARCAEAPPPPIPVSDTQAVACYLYDAEPASLA